MASNALSNIEGASSVHVLGDARCAEAMAADPFLESACPGSGLHQPPNAPAVHVPELKRFLVFSERREKRSRGVRANVGGCKPLVDGFPGLRVHRHLMSLPALFRKPQPALPFPLVVIFDLECHDGRNSRPAVE